MDAIKIFVKNYLTIKDFLRRHRLWALFLATFVFHALVVLIIYAAHIQSFFSGGDDVVYNTSAIAISQQFLKGNFLLKGVPASYSTFYLGTFFTILIAIVYMIFPATMITGALFNAILASMISVFVYLIVMELGGSSKKALIAGVLVALYPSLILNSALLLKDALVVLLTMASLLLTIKLIKKINLWQFALLYLLLIAIVNLRFYLGDAIMITFIICWFSFCRSVEFKKRILCVIMVIFLFGFIPQIAYHQGYWGYESFKTYLNVKRITFYREIAYNTPPAPLALSTPHAPLAISSPSPSPSPSLSSGPSSSVNTSVIPAHTTAKNSHIPSTTSVANKSVATSAPCLSNCNQVTSVPIGNNSNLDIKIDFKNPLSILINYPKSFIYVSLGPFPWQTKFFREKLALLETIPWYFLLYFIARGMLREIKKKNIFISPLVVFSLIFLAVIALFDINYGNFMRIRMAAFVSLMCLFPFGLNMNNKFLSTYYEKILSYGRSWVYRFKHR